MADIEPGILEDDYEGEYHIDPERNVFVLNGVEYPAKSIPNPDHFTGAKLAGAAAFEAMNPYSPFMLPLVVHATELDVPFWALALYIVKAFFWICLSSLKNKKLQ